MTAALEGGEWSAARSGHTSRPGKTRCTLYRRLGGTQDRSGRAENLVATGIRSRTVQSVVNRYTDWATRPKKSVITSLFHLYLVLKSRQLSSHLARLLMTSQAAHTAYISVLRSAILIGMPNHEDVNNTWCRYWGKNVLKLLYSLIAT